MYLTPYNFTWFSLTVKNPLWAWAWCLHLSYEEKLLAVQVGPFVLEVVTG